MEFPKTCIEGKLSSDSVQFEQSGDPDFCDLYIRDDSVEIARLGQTSVTVRAFIRRTGDPENIILPRIDVAKKLLIFKWVKDGDDLVIDGNEYEIICSCYPDQVEWYIQ